MGSPCGRLFAHGEPDGRVPSLHAGLIPQRCGDRAGRLPALQAGLLPGHWSLVGAGNRVAHTVRRYRQTCSLVTGHCSLVGVGAGSCRCDNEKRGPVGGAPFWGNTISVAALVLSRGTRFQSQNMLTVAEHVNSRRTRFQPQNMLTVAEHANSCGTR